MSMFKKGYSAVREESQRQEENRENMGKKLWRFFLQKDGEEADVRFLTEEPINFYEHTVKEFRGGKERYNSIVCTSESEEGCPLCDSGDRASFKGAFLLYDKRPYEFTDKNGKKQKMKGQLRLYIQGARVLSQLDRLSERYGLTNRDYTITRSGSGTSTTYMFDRGDNTSKLTKAEITDMLPEKLRPSYDGSMNSLYEIVEEQLTMMMESQKPNSFSDDDEDDDEVAETTERNLVGIDDEEDEEDLTKLPTRPGLFKTKKPRENSVKPLFKKK